MKDFEKLNIINFEKYNGKGYCVNKECKDYNIHKKILCDYGGNIL